MTLNLKSTWFFAAIMLLVAFLLIEVIIIFATDTDAIVTAQPAYTITLAVVGLASLLTLVILLSRSRKVFRLWVKMGGGGNGGLHPARQGARHLPY